MENMYTGGQLVVKVMEEFGAKFVFGIPGGQTLAVNTAMYDSSVKFVHTRNENGAATAADGYGRLTGEPGICLATTGPGATNLITGLGGALRDSSPVIALVFQNKLPDVGRGDAQECNHEAIFTSICKKYIAVRSASSVVWAMREAYRVAKSGRPGPVVVDLYRDVVEDQKAPYAYMDPKTYCPMPASVASCEEIAAAAEAIKAAKKPCIWVGNGVKLANAAEEVKALSRRINAPVITSYNGLAAIESSFENLVGPRTRHGSEISLRALEEADCVIVVGSSLSGVGTSRWSLKPQNIIQFELVAENIAHQYPVSVGVIGDAKRNLQKVYKALDGAEFSSEYLKHILEEKAKWEKKTLSGPIADINATPVPPIALQMELGRYLKEDTIFVVDAGNPGAWTHITRFPKGTAYFKPVNYGNMGFALGASIGCKEAAPDREVFALIGDGSLGMTLGELETMVRENLHIIVLLVNDNAFGNIRQEELYKTGTENYIGVDFPQYDYLNVAKAFGFEGSVVTKASELGEAIEKARRTEKPCMIEVKLDGSYSVWPSCF